MTEATAKHYDTITAPIITEKATIGAEHNQYVFKVPLSATKPDIAEAVEALFDVKVKAVNTLINKGKAKRFRGRPYTRSDVKKAMVTLEDGHAIDVTTGL
ncbi:MAG: 50S ribosomal protein L23 [Pseudomonadota bacterium]